MRAATLMLCLVLAACAGGKLPADLTGGAGMPAVAAASAPASAPAANATAASAPAASSEPSAPDLDLVTQARVDCWMKVERQKGLRDIDRRIAFVDKCVADALKAQSR